jgi:hypothetical protein
MAFTFGLLAWMAAAPVPAPARRAMPAAPIPTAPPRAAIAPRSIVVGAAGDVACASEPAPSDRPDSCQYDDTADLLDGLTAVLVLGDGQYETGNYDAYMTYYGSTWGRFRTRTFPAPGNHEYAQDPNAAPNGYFRYFGDRVRGPDGLGYYSFNLPRGCAPGRDVCWHVIALSSELCFAGGGCGPADDPGDPGSGNRMYRWLRRDLRSHPDADYPCTLAFWHHPLFSISDGSGDTPGTRPLWQLLYEARADVVLNGHSHNYQRWVPQDPFGTHDPVHGIREFVAGTGGASKYPFRTGSAPNLAAWQNDAFGIVQLVLHRTGYSWRWVPAAGQPAGFTDVGTGVACV